MESITIREKRLMTEIINNGNKHAAKAFSTITGQNVRIVSTDTELCTKHDYLKDTLGHDENITVLQTDIIGQIQGSSYLIFNEEEKSTISKMTSAAFGSKTIIEDTVILIEIDNILSAAVITELSNKLKLSIYGDVPQLFELNNILDFQTQINNGGHEYYILAKTNFIFDNHQTISPIFIWKMNKMLITYANNIKIGA